MLPGLGGEQGFLQLQRDQRGQQWQELCLGTHLSPGSAALSAQGRPKRSSVAESFQTSFRLFPSTKPGRSMPGGDFSSCQLWG